MAYVVQKIMGKRLGHYWRKIVWILLTIKMCFPFWSVTEKFRQHFFIISMPAYYMGEQNQKTAIMTKIGNVSIREVDVRRKIFAVYMACRDDFMPFVSRNTI